MKTLAALAKELNRDLSSIKKRIKKHSLPVNLIPLGPQKKLFISDEDAEQVKRFYEQEAT